MLTYTHGYDWSMSYLKCQIFKNQMTKGQNRYFLGIRYGPNDASYKFLGFSMEILIYSLRNK